MVSDLFDITNAFWPSIKADLPLVGGKTPTKLFIISKYGRATN